MPGLGQPVTSGGAEKLHRGPYGAGDASSAQRGARLGVVQCRSLFTDYHPKLFEFFIWLVQDLLPNDSWITGLRGLRNSLCSLRMADGGLQRTVSTQLLQSEDDQPMDESDYGLRFGPGIAIRLG